MHPEQGLSPTHEMYLKVLYRQQTQNRVGRVGDMAKGLGVTPGTVSAVLKKLERSGLVVHDRYGAVKLTPAGIRIGECVVRRFEIIRELLVHVLGVDAESEQLDACTMEHAVSPATVNRMEALIEAVRNGDVAVPLIDGPMQPAADRSDCEAVGACQAAAAVRSPTSS